MNQSYINKLEKINKNNLRGKSGLGQLDTIEEWLKWLKYEPEFETKAINSIEKKKAKDLSLDELYTLTTYKERQEMILLINKYKEGCCSTDEYLKVLNYINKPIDSIVLDKLSKNELACVKSHINSVSNYTKEELQNMMLNYDELNMIDAYLLHIALDYAFVNKLGKTNRKM